MAGGDVSASDLEAIGVEASEAKCIADLLHERQAAKMRKSEPGSKTDSHSGVLSDWAGTAVRSAHEKRG